MTMDPELREEIKRRMAALPQSVQDAIAAIDIEKQLRSVSSTHKLHVDQWAILENQVMLTLLGFQNPMQLAGNIESEVGVTSEEASVLAHDISTIVFEPIREELERQLEHPEARGKQISAEEAARNQILATEGVVAGVAPATPPTPKPTEKATRAPISSSYTARGDSAKRKDVSGDPYREAPI